jgi:ERCC4-related helicase
LIWFLAPTVALCIQQYEVICSHLPAVKACTLTGLDKVDRWKNQSIWDEVLKEKQVVVSTHAVLLDALTHGFVKISELGLIVFDEGMFFFPPPPFLCFPPSRICARVELANTRGR